MAAPTFVQAADGQVDTLPSDGWGAATSVSFTSGNVVLLHAFLDDVGDIGLTSATNVEKLDGTDGNMDQITSTLGGRNRIWIGRSLGGALTPTGTGTSGSDLFWRVYEFTNVNAGTTLASVIENGSAGNVTSTDSSGTTIADEGVTTLGVDRLALNLIYVNDNDTIAGFTGETGGDWGEAVAEFSSGSGTQACLSLQTAAMPTAGTINGGTITIPTDFWGVVGFALIGNTEPSFVPRSFIV